VLLGGLQDGECQSLEQLVIRGDECQVHLPGLVHREIGKACGNASTGGFGGDLLTALGQIVLTIGILPMGQRVSILLGYTAGEVSIIINSVQPTAYSVRSCVAPACSSS